MWAQFGETMPEKPWMERIQYHVEHRDYSEGDMVEFALCGTSERQMGIVSKSMPGMLYIDSDNGRAIIIPGHDWIHQAIFPASGK